jgi:hypothetical protein
MSKITLSDTSGGFNISTINDNFQAIQDEFNDKVLYRDNPEGEPNTLETSVDANEQIIYNLPEPLLSSQAARLADITNAIAGGAANLISFTPYLTVVSTNVQSAIQDVIDKFTVYATSAGASLIGFIQAGVGAILRTTQAKLRETVSAEDYSSVQAAITANPACDILLTLPTYTWGNGDEITLGTGQILKGRGKGGTVITYTGTGIPIKYISSSGTGVRIYASGGRDFVLLAANATVCIDCDSLSEGAFDHVTVAGATAGRGFKFHSSVSGGSVYNRLYDVKAQTCLVGFDLVRDGVGVSSYTNETTFMNCRAQSCTTGLNISGGNHNMWIGGSIENNTTGFTFSEPASATTQQNVIAKTRFEANTADGTIGAGVVDVLLSENMYVNGDTITDSGTRTNRTGTYGNQHKRVSAQQMTGGSFKYERTANGGASIPAFVIKDSSAVNVPVTLELQNSATDLGARSFRTRFGGDAGTVKFGIVAINGKITDLSTTNGPVGSFTCDAAATTTISNTAVTAASFIFLQPANASAGTLQGSVKSPFISARTAGTSFAVRTADNTAAVGTETFFYWIVN